MILAEGIVPEREGSLILAVLKYVLSADANKLETAVSTYNLVVASVLSVGVAKLINF